MVKVVIYTSGSMAYFEWEYPNLAAYTSNPSSKTGADGGKSPDEISFLVEDKGSPTVPVGFFAEYSVENRKVYLRSPSSVSIALLDLTSVIPSPAASEKIGELLALALSGEWALADMRAKLSAAVQGVSKIIHPLLKTCLKVLKRYKEDKASGTVDLYSLFFEGSGGGVGDRAWMSTLVRLITEDMRVDGVSLTDDGNAGSGGLLKETFVSLMEKTDVSLTASLVRINSSPDVETLLREAPVGSAYLPALATQAWNGAGPLDPIQNESIWVTNLIALSELSRDNILFTYNDFVNVEGDPSKSKEAKKLLASYAEEYASGNFGQGYAKILSALAGSDTSKMANILSSRAFEEAASKTYIAAKEDLPVGGDLAILLPINKIMKRVVQKMRSIKI